MSLESHSQAVNDSQKLAQIFAQIGAPDHLLQQIMHVSQQHGPQMLTAVLATISIILINQGSSKYAELSPSQSEEENREVTRVASGQIALGALGMATTAFASGNPLFAYPQAIGLVAALKPYLEASMPRVGRALQAVRANILVKVAAIGVGVTTAMPAPGIMDTLPPLSLASLSVAFSGNVRQEIYRVLTISGGSGLVVGSAYAAHEAYKTQNAVGLIMSLAFLALNALFTRNEWKEVQKMGGAKKVIASTCEAVWSRMRSLGDGTKKQQNGSVDR